MAFWRSIPLKTSLLFTIIIILLNASYYQHYKEMLIDNQKDKMNLLFKNIEINVDETATGEKFVMDLIGQNLRTAAIAAKLKLNPDISKVTNEELTELKQQIGVDDITLFAPVGDDFVGLKSSDPKELNVSSKGWDTYYEAFKQLYALKDVNVGIGQSLPYYWSGPVDTATTNPTELNIWGYYYDGTTNYIIDPFVHNKTLRKYQDLTGVDDAIDRLLKDNRHTALEIAVLNSDKLLGKKLPVKNPAPSYWFSEREVLFGSYEYRDEEEKKYAESALARNETVFYVTESNGKSVMKSFTPVHTDYLKYNASSGVPLIEITSDYTEISKALNDQLRETVGFMAICTLIVLLLMMAILWVFKRNKALALQDVQEAYVGNIETLFQSVREQRHDFINHIQTIHGLLSIKNYDELQKYTNALVGEIRVVGELINIKDPALIALMQAKLTQADSLHITCEYDFKNMEQLKLSPVRATDMIKILSNLIDNAFDATLALEEPRRKVRVTGEVSNRQLRFSVSNTGPEIPEEWREAIFASGFSTKPKGKNSGLGLHIVKQLVARYKGTVELKCGEGTTEFSIVIQF